MQVSVAHGSACASSPVVSESDDVDMDSDLTTNGDRSDHEATPRPEAINENDPVSIMPFLGRVEQAPERHDVCIVGAGPAGLMLGYPHFSLIPILRRSHGVFFFFSLSAHMD